MKVGSVRCRRSAKETQELSGDEAGCCASVVIPLGERIFDVGVEEE